MDRNALITGGTEAADAAASVLAMRGWKVLGPASPPGPVSCYVQMPTGHQGLSARVDQLVGVAPRLGEGATVLLAVDDDSTPELLAALAAVVLEDIGRTDARIAVIPAGDLLG